MASNKEAVWPPQTTADVLNLTPRKSRLANQNQTIPTSPSPLRRTATLTSPLGGSDDEDEDEETLQLKLAQIEAKLKLKRLQKKQASQQAPRARAEVQVPLSPTSNKTEPPVVPKSPSRVLLGIDKGLTGRDVSLRRAPSLRTGSARSVPSSPQRPKKTFSERIAEERRNDRAKAERQRLVENSRSKGFLSFSTGPPPVFGGGGESSSSVMTVVRPPLPTAAKGMADPFVSEPSTNTTAPDDPPGDDGEGGFDSFSGLHLSKRLIPHVTLSRHLSTKTVFLLPHLLKSIVSPSFEPPDVEGDWVVMGVISSKSLPRDVGQNTTSKETGQKYMVLQLTDLKWELELFLFGGGFEKFWKVGVGTVVAIMNPGVMKPRNADTGRFSLTLSDSADQLLEIGHARDMDFCKTIKRDGKRCAAWVDKRHTHYCAFHVEATVNRARVSRAEVNSATRMFSPPKKGSTRPRKFFGRKAHSTGERDDGLLPDLAGGIADLPQRVGGAGGKVFIAPARSTSALIDADTDSLQRGSKDDRLRKRLAEAQKERELTKRIIAAQGREGGVGVDYLKKQVNWGEEELGRRRESATPSLPKEGQNAHTLTSLRQKAKEATSVSLSPIKRKRLASPNCAKKKTRFAGLDAVEEEDDDDLLIV